MSNIIWFKEPTNEWEEGMPIGNGRLGAMILGNVEQEKIHLCKRYLNVTFRYLLLVWKDKRQNKK